MTPCKIINLSPSALANKQFLRRPDRALWKDANASGNGTFDASSKCGLLVKCATCGTVLEDASFAPGAYAQCPDCGADSFFVQEFQAAAATASAARPATPRPPHASPHMSTGAPPSPMHAAPSPAAPGAPLSMWQYYKRAWTFPSVRRASYIETNKVTNAAYLISLILGALTALLLITCTELGKGSHSWKDWMLMSVFFSSQYFFLQLPIIGIPLWVRRFHDVGYSGKNIWWVVPVLLIGSILGILLLALVPATRKILFTKEYDDFTNMYGPPPPEYAALPPVRRTPRTTAPALSPSPRKMFSIAMLVIWCMSIIPLFSLLHFTLIEILASEYDAFYDEASWLGNDFWGTDFSFMADVGISDKRFGIARCSTLCLFICMLVTFAWSTAMLCKKISNKIVFISVYTIILASQLIGIKVLGMYSGFWSHVLYDQQERGEYRLSRRCCAFSPFPHLNKGNEGHWLHAGNAYEMACDGNMESLMALENHIRHTRKYADCGMEIPWNLSGPTYYLDYPDHWEASDYFRMAAAYEKQYRASEEAPYSWRELAIELYIKSGDKYMEDIKLYPKDQSDKCDHFLLNSRNEYVCKSAIKAYQEAYQLSPFRNDIKQRDMYGKAWKKLQTSITKLGNAHFVLGACYEAKANSAIASSEYEKAKTEYIAAGIYGNKSAINALERIQSELPNNGSPSLPRHPGTSRPGPNGHPFDSTTQPMLY